MKENYQIVCYSKDSDWEQVIKTGLSEENAWEMLAEYNSMEANGHQGFYINQANDQQDGQANRKNYRRDIFRIRESFH